MTERRYPIHLAVLVGASTAAYAVSLAGITALQSTADLTAVDRQSPVEQMATRIRVGHDRLQDELARSADAYAASASRYDEIAANLAALETSLDAYAGQIGQVSGAARALPARVRLPVVSRSVTTTVTKPRVRSTTGASGK